MYGGIVSVVDELVDDKPALAGFMETQKLIVKRKAEEAGYRCVDEPAAELLENRFPAHHVAEDGFEWDDPNWVVRVSVHVEEVA